MGGEGRRRDSTFLTDVRGVTCGATNANRRFTPGVCGKDRVGPRAPTRSSTPITRRDDLEPVN